jgi:hypothetical protein
MKIVYNDKKIVKIRITPPPPPKSATGRGEQKEGRRLSARNPNTRTHPPLGRLTQVSNRKKKRKEKKGK